VLVLNRLDHTALGQLVDRAVAIEGRPLPLTPDARAALIAGADGDGRVPAAALARGAFAEICSGAV
jgi:putative ATPase